AAEPPPQLTRPRELRRPQKANSIVQPRAIQIPRGGSETGTGRAARISARQRASSESIAIPPAAASRSAIGNPALATRRRYAARPPSRQTSPTSVARAPYARGRGTAPGGRDRRSSRPPEPLPWP